MTKASRPSVLRPPQIARIDSAIADAESQTSAELVPVIALRSGEYWHAPYQSGLWGMGAALFLTTVVSMVIDHTWPVLHVGWYLAISIVGFLSGALLARIDGVERVFAGDDVMVTQCQARARQLFAAQGVFGTKNRTGVLLYISLFERVALVIGDSTISRKLDPSAYGSVVAAVTTRMHEDRLEDAVIDGLSHLGALLAEHFPKAADDENELPNKLVLVT